MICPNCGKCPYLEGQCVERISRGRRFFLMGALALPVAAKIETLAPIVAPAPPSAAPVVAFYGFVAKIEAGTWRVSWEAMQLGQEEPELLRSELITAETKWSP